MLIWFATMSVVLTWLVFQSPALDYRLVALGSIIPLIEVPIGAGPLHSLVAPTAVLAATMLLTQKRRMVRRRWLGISIGMYLHLVLDAAFTRSQSFWWPFLGVGFAPGSAPELSRGLLSAGMELVGIGVGMWAYGRFGLDDPGRRHKFLRTGQLDRSIMGEAERGC